uniref:(northern house mosquito) hypothetical protein n=1 Tax=Culex pipiens TaxID=7175 RepID=A0A8D8P2B8_CULPI
MLLQSATLTARARAFHRLGPIKSLLVKLHQHVQQKVEGLQPVNQLDIRMIRSVPFDVLLQQDQLFRVAGASTEQRILQLFSLTRCPRWKRVPLDDPLPSDADHALARVGRLVVWVGLPPAGSVRDHDLLPFANGTQQG